MPASLPLPYNASLPLPSNALVLFCRPRCSAWCWCCLVVLPGAWCWPVLRAAAGTLVTLLREVRQLQALGHTVPAVVKKAAATADAFYRHAVTLKQIANFYNSMESQVLPCQKGMLLESAMAFEKVVKAPRMGAEGKSIAWTNASELETYIRATSPQPRIVHTLSS